MSELGISEQTGNFGQKLEILISTYGKIKQER